MSVEPADVKAAEDLSLNALSYSAGFCTVEDVTSRLALALAAAREEGRRAEREAVLAHLQEWTAINRERGIRTGDADDAAAGDTLVAVHRAILRGDYLRALTPEGKR
jgi:hypothetical protein